MQVPTTVTLPVFPLPDYFLFPGILAPLHIFEERYRQMVGDLMDRSGRLVMTSVPSRWSREEGVQPRLHSHGCLAEIMKHDRLPDGRYLLLLLGLTRVRISEVVSERLYRQVEAEAIAEVSATEEEESELRPRLQDVLQKRGGQRIELAQELPMGVLADTLLQVLKLPPERMEEMLREPSVAARSRMALLWSEERS